MSAVTRLWAGEHLGRGSLSDSHRAAGPPVERLHRFYLGDPFPVYFGGQLCFLSSYLRHVFIACISWDSHDP